MTPEDEGGGPIYDPDNGKPIAVIIQNPKRVYKESRTKWRRERRPLSPAERRWCVDFFRKFNKKSPANAGDGPIAFAESNDEIKEQVANMEKVNEVKITGVIMQITPDQADRFFALVEVGQEKWVPVSAHEKDPNQRAGLIADLLKYEKGDQIVLKGYVRPWSQKMNDGWKNGLDIRIIDLKPDTIPNRAARQPQAAQKKRDTAAPPNGW